jgi:hypothetical protein
MEDEPTDDDPLALKLAALLKQRSAATAAKLRPSLLPPEEILALAQEAMRRHRCLRLGYHGYFRLVEVHIVGRTAKGNAAISGYQVKGGKPGAAQGWKNLKFDDIISAEIDERASLAPRPDYNPDDPQFPHKDWQV